MLELKEEKHELTEEDLLVFYQEYGGAINAIRKAFRAFVDDLNERGADIMPRSGDARIAIEPDEIWLKTKDYYLIHREETRTGRM